MGILDDFIFHELRNRIEKVGQAKSRESNARKMLAAAENETITAAADLASFIIETGEKVEVGSNEQYRVQYRSRMYGNDYVFAQTSARDESSLCITTPKGHETCYDLSPDVIGRKL